MAQIAFDLEALSETIKNEPRTALALARTVLANDRTLLSYLRTWLSLLAGGIGLVTLVEHEVLTVMGWVAILLSLVVLWIGVRRFIHTNQLLAHVRKEIHLVRSDELADARD